MANPIQQGLKHNALVTCKTGMTRAAMANPIQQGLKPVRRFTNSGILQNAAMANPIQQGLKPRDVYPAQSIGYWPQWLIQYNKD